MNMKSRESNRKAEAINKILSFLCLVLIGLQLGA
jgi:hypothetical protein